MNMSGKILFAWCAPAAKPAVSIGDRGRVQNSTLVANLWVRPCATEILHHIYVRQRTEYAAMQADDGVGKPRTVTHKVSQACRHFPRRRARNDAGLRFHSDQRE